MTVRLPPLTTMAAPALLLGPAHAGKSELAIQLLAPDQPAIVIGTAAAEMRASETFARRLGHLQGLRPPPWETLETLGKGADLAAALDQAARKAPQVLVDSVSQWLAGLVISAAEEQDGAAREAEVATLVEGRVSELLSVLQAHPAVRIVFVTSETGSGPTPQRPAERLFRRLAGESHQRLAVLCKTVLTVHAGIPVIIKS